jgi:hypothetical protein
MTVYMLSLDPATGSGESKPAFALWELQPGGKCKLVDCGVVITKGSTHWARMQSLCDQLPVKLAETFGSIKGLERIKQVVIEGLSPVMGGSFGGGTNRAFLHLHHAVAVMCCAYPWPEIEELYVQTWKSFLSAMGAAHLYKKSDTHDAIVIGLAWLCEQGSQIPEIPPSLMKNMGLPPFLQEHWEVWGKRMAFAHGEGKSKKPKKPRAKPSGGRGRVAPVKKPRVSKPK